MPLRTIQRSPRNGCRRSSCGPPEPLKNSLARVGCHHPEGPGKNHKDLNRDTQVLRLKDEIQFLQVASQQRLEEQASWNAICEKWV